MFTNISFYGLHQHMVFLMSDDLNTKFPRLQHNTAITRHPRGITPMKNNTFRRLESMKMISSVITAMVVATMNKFICAEATEIYPCVRKFQKPQILNIH